jgi:hypothetical protein
MRWFVSLLLAAAPLAAQTEPPVRLKLECAKSPCTFHMGEVIPLELAFTSSVAKRYQINTAQYSDSRMNGDTFEVTPRDGVRDPLQNYVVFGGAAGSMLMTFQYLSAQPVNIKVTLNEAVRFDRPGSYRLRATSTRVSDTSVTTGGMGKGVAVNSNQIELEILPAEPDWQQRELRRIVQSLSQPQHTNEPLTALRFLGTEEAARELARRLGAATQLDEYPCMFGLIGSPHSDAGLAEMNVLLRDADFPVTATFLRTMAYLSLRAGDAPEVLEKQFDENLESNRAALAAALASKRGKAMAVSAETALDGLAPNAPESLRKALAQQLQRNFDALPAESQANWLRYRWDQIKDPAWIPVLQKVATAYEDFSQPRALLAYQSLQASGAALRRWYELDPEGARSAVIAEIVRAKPRYGADVLGMLKDESLPEVEPALVESLAQTDNFEVESNILALLERYGTGAALGELIGSRAELVGKWACTPQEHFLGYVLKFDPVSARPLIERAIEARGTGSNACRHNLLVDLGAKHAGPLLEELALKALHDSDAEVAGNAALYLERYGSETAEQPLWTRYIAWSRQWLGREKELRITFGAGQNPNTWEANLGQALARALVQGNGWLCDEARLQRILELAVGEHVRSVAEKARISIPDRSIHFLRGQPDQPAWFFLAQYDQITLDQLHKKLAQYPPGTQFHWAESGQPASAEEKQALRDVSAAVAQAGMKLVRD